MELMSHVLLRSPDLLLEEFLDRCYSVRDLPPLDIRRFRLFSCLFHYPCRPYILQLSYVFNVPFLGFLSFQFIFI